MTLQMMPDIWDDKIFFTSNNIVLGELAAWSIRQSPYLQPDNLSEALIEFNKAFKTEEEYFHINCIELHKKIRESFEQCPIILGWNNAKIGNHKFVFVSRDHQQKPDYDFIDLDALARNIAHSITLAEKYSQLHDSSHNKT